MENIKVDFEDRVGGLSPLDAYTGSTNTFDLLDYEMKQVLDDVILVQFIDCSENGAEIMRGGIYLPMNAMQQNQAWRLGRVLLAGPKCQWVKQGDIVSMPGDKGLRISNVPVAGQGSLNNCCFLNEARIFAIVQKKQ